jgi:hypothetical protein
MEFRRHPVTVPRHDGSPIFMTFLVPQPRSQSPTASGQEPAVRALCSHVPRLTEGPDRHSFVVSYVEDSK